MTVETIKEAIARLPECERHSLSAWLNELAYDDWDRKMSADFSPGGRGMGLVEIVKSEIARGRAVPFEKGLQQSRSEQDRQQR